MENEKTRRSILDEATKQKIRTDLRIDPESEILNPLVDYVFKRIFTADDTNAKAALIDFINSVLEYENDDTIVDLTIVNPEIAVARGVEKKSIFDIRAKYNNGRQAIIEMQKAETSDFKRRSQHIISKAYASQEISGFSYNKLEKVYLIAITDFEINQEANEYIKDYRFRDRKGNDLTDSQTIVYLDLSKTEAILAKEVNEMKSVEKWAIFFKHITDVSKKKILDKIIEGGAGIKMAANILMEVSKEEEARAYYESELIFELDQNGRLRQAREQGFEQGVEQGIEQMVIKMLKKNQYSVEEIAEAAEFSAERISEIEKTLEKG
jgi:predicted transposase/invertase (TIGR01784 family)